jgi:hypothetical protein
MTHEDHDASRKNKNRDCRPPKKHLPFLVRNGHWPAIQLFCGARDVAGDPVARRPPGRVLRAGSAGRGPRGRGIRETG